MKTFKTILITCLIALTASILVARPNHFSPGPFRRPPVHHGHHRGDWWIPAAIIGGSIIVGSAINNSTSSTTTVVVPQTPPRRVIRIDVLPDGTKVYHYGE